MGSMLRSSPSREARLRVEVQVSLTVVTHKSSPRSLLQSYYDLQLYASSSCMYKLTSIHCTSGRHKGPCLSPCPFRKHMRG